MIYLSTLYILLIKTAQFTKKSLSYINFESKQFSKSIISINKMRQLINFNSK